MLLHQRQVTVNVVAVYMLESEQEATSNKHGAEKYVLT